MDEESKTLENVIRISIDSEKEVMFYKIVSSILLTINGVLVGIVCFLLS